LRQSITLYKNLGGLEQNLGGLEPLSPIASAATAVHTQRNLSSATRNIKYTSRDQVEYMTNEILLGHRPIAKTQLIIRHKLQTQYYYPCRYSQEWSNDDLVVH